MHMQAVHETHIQALQELLHRSKDDEDADIEKSK